MVSTAILFVQNLVLSDILCLDGRYSAPSVIKSILHETTMLLMNVKNIIISPLVIVVFLGTLFNLNFAIFGLSESVTSVRIALLVSILIFFYYAIKYEGRISVLLLKDKATFWGLISVIVVAISLTISFFCNMEVGSFNYVLTAWLQVVLYFFFSVLLANEDKTRLLNVFIVMIFVFVAILGGFFLSKIAGHGLYQVRGELNEVLPQGLNRFLNGYVFLWVIPIGVLFGALPKSVMNIFVSVLVSLIGVLLLVYSGSRQYLISVFLLVFFASLIGERKSKSVFILIVFLGTLFLIFGSLEFDGLKSQLYRRFVEVTADQSAYGSARLDRYGLMFLQLSDKPLTGLGPGGFVNVTGLYPDSGILQFLVENGVILFAIHMLFVFVTLAAIFLHYKDYSEISRLVFVFFVVNFAVQNLFNELFLEYYTWLVLPLAAFLKSYNPRID